MKMEIAKRYAFEAAHQLPRHPGKCRFLHGHSYELEIRIRGDVDVESGFVLDYGMISRIAKPLIDCLDHSYLNAVITYPSAEVISWAIWRGAFDLDPDVTIVVRETARTSCSTMGADFTEPIGRLADMPNPESVGPFPVPADWQGDWGGFVRHCQARWRGALAYALETWKEARSCR